MNKLDPMLLSAATASRTKVLSAILDDGDASREGGGNGAEAEAGFEVRRTVRKGFLNRVQQMNNAVALKLDWLV